MNDYKARIRQHAADIASNAPGTALPDFEALAEEVVGHLAGYHISRGWVATRRQDIDYLARTLQAVHERSKETR